MPFLKYRHSRNPIPPSLDLGAQPVEGGPATGTGSARLNRLVLLGAVVLVAIGLTIALLLVLEPEEASSWIRTGNPATLLARLILVCLLFLSYLLREEHRVRSLRSQWQHTLARSAERVCRSQDHAAGMVSLVRLRDEVSPEALLGAVTDMCRYIFPCDQASLMLLDARREHLEVRSASGHPDRAHVLSMGQRVGHGIAGRVAERRESLLLGPHIERKKYARLKDRGYSISSAMVVPVLRKSELIGVLNLSSRTPETLYSAEDLQRLEVFARTVGEVWTGAGGAS